MIHHSHSEDQVFNPSALAPTRALRGGEDVAFLGTKPKQRNAQDDE